jgi:hypothetical protein
MIRARMNRKDAIRKYKETPHPMGVYCVRNTETGKVFVGTSVNLPAVLNRERFQLEHGSHPNRALQSDWKRLGASAFELMALDALEPSDKSGNDPADDLRTLEAMWRETLAKSGELYN